MRRTALKDTAIPSIFTFPDDEQPGTKRIRRETPISSEGEEPSLLTSTPLKTLASVQELFASTSVRFADVACQTDPPTTRSCGTQLSMTTHTPPFRSTGGAVSCTDTSAVRASGPSRKRPRLDLKEEDEEERYEGPHDVTYDPLHSLTLTQSTDVKTEPSSPPHKIAKYIVYESCLLELFELCPRCGRASRPRTRTMGTFLRVEQNCPHCGVSRTWNSQPIIGSVPAGNLQLAAAVYTSGASFSTLERIFQAMKLQLYKSSTFRSLARRFTEPAVVHRWRRTQDAALEQLTSQRHNVMLAGGMRADSPGNSATYGSYTMMDLRSNMVVDLQLVQSNAVAGRCQMEMEGLKRSLALLEERGVTVNSIVTERHPQIQEFLKETRIKHYYDVWRIEKGLSKKLALIAKNKDCDLLKKWLPSIKNHMYWTAASSTSGPERLAKWTSILNHIRDVHVHEDPAFPQCAHAPRTSRDKRKWLKAGTEAFIKVEKALTNKRMLKAVEKMSPHRQASALEAFHSSISRFAPKNAVFPFLGMLCRLYLAAMHFNENAGRPQATSSTGELLYRLNLPKSKKGEFSIKPVKVDPTYDYVDGLMDLIFEKVFEDPGPYEAEVQKIPIPDDLSAQFEKPDKMEVIASYVSRFNQGRGLNPEVGELPAYP
ncbi:uncharacterized protein LOC130088048 [Rhinichthys klamathensis goyatoka]|uniref:uncharacterized protein LOC130088048 n=1 Tax=Rhinichthys klamathensis goyatoka TaxID=3034132 RepID=UPI0024B513D2|nr:uncharacterized protein LOC130088048 [Rhinichthys klamathensis goyatoka]